MRVLNSTKQEKIQGHLEGRAMRVLKYESKMTTQYFSRKHPAHHPPIENSDRPTVLFVTTCVKGRRPLLAKNDVHVLIREAWKKADQWQVNRYVVMPDHIHLFCCPTHAQTSSAKWCQYWRYLVTRNWPRKDEKPIWQKDNWDTQIRSAASFTEKWNYVRNNPVRRGLVSGPDEWEYQGEVYPFVWIER